MKILPKRTRGPNSRVITIPCLPYSPSPALIAKGIARAVSLRLGTAKYPRFNNHCDVAKSTSASYEYPKPTAAPESAEGTVSTRSWSIACPMTMTPVISSGRSLGRPSGLPLLELRA